MIFALIFIYYHLLTSSKATLTYHLFIIGSSLLFIFISNIVSGSIITFYHRPNLITASMNKSFIIYDVSFGRLFIIAYSNRAPIFMLLLYMHILRNIRYFAFSHSPTLWISGYILFSLAIIEPFIDHHSPFKKHKIS